MLEMKFNGMNKEIEYTSKESIVTEFFYRRRVGSLIYVATC